MNNQYASEHCKQWISELVAQGITLKVIAKETCLSVFTLKLIIKGTGYDLYPRNFTKLFRFYLAMTVKFN